MYKVRAVAISWLISIPKKIVQAFLADIDLTFSCGLTWPFVALS
jgi:hypothetical protein